MKNFFFRISVLAVFLSSVPILKALASCEECEISKSCEAYQECMAARLNKEYHPAILRRFFSCPAPAKEV
jgi:hypothetical protein